MQTLIAVALIGGLFGSGGGCNGGSCSVSSSMDCSSGTCAQPTQYQPTQYQPVRSYYSQKIELLPPTEDYKFARQSPLVRVRTAAMTREVSERRPTAEPGPAYDRITSINPNPSFEFYEQ